MVNLNTIEKLRTRKEVEDYFKQLGRKITDEELTALKQSYDKAQESSGTLTMQQLDYVAGGFYGERNLGKLEHKNGKIQADAKTPVYIISCLFGRPDRTINFLGGEVVNGDRERILQDPNFLPIFYTKKNSIYCFPINKNLNATEMEDSLKECIKKYLYIFDAERLIDSFADVKDSLSEYDLEQLTSIERLVKAVK